MKAIEKKDSGKEGIRKDQMFFFGPEPEQENGQTEALDSLDHEESKDKGTVRIVFSCGLKVSPDYFRKGS